MSNRSQPVVMEKPADLSVIEKEGLPEEVRFEVSKGNLVRAAHLAIQKGVSRDKTRKLQCDAVRHFIEVLHNFEGAKELVSAYDLNSEEVRTILHSVMENPRADTQSVTCFSQKRGRMVAMTLAQRIQGDPMFRKYL
jgi:hypothetical protein